LPNGETSPGEASLPARSTNRPAPSKRRAPRGEKGRSQAVTETKLIVNLTRGEDLCVGELADRPLPRMRGLMGRRGLPAGEGLLISPALAIHTAFMRFPIDALFLDRELRVLKIVAGLRPWRLSSKPRAHGVLELPAGECARRGVQIGDRLELRDRPQGDARQFSASRAVDAQTQAQPPAAKPAVDLSGEAVRRLQPLRVVVSSPDRHFRTATSLLLGRQNCSVIATGNPTRVGELIAREHADVVVIDADPPAAAATVEALARPVGVVLVADEAGSELDDPPVIAKWGPFINLFAAIQLVDERRWT
jgi:uncharacterized protein